MEGEREGGKERGREGGKERGRNQIDMDPPLHFTLLNSLHHLDQNDHAPLPRFIEGHLGVHFHHHLQTIQYRQ